jgi:hypothetical protein
MHKKSFDPPASADRWYRNTTGWPADRDAADIEIAAYGATCKSIICRPVLPYKRIGAVPARALASSSFREFFRETAGAACTVMVAPRDQRGR